MKTIAELLNWGKESLAGHEVPLLEAQVLLAHALGCDRSSLYAWPDKEISATQEAVYTTLIARRQQHEPLAYIIGNKEFWSLSFEVTQDTLIPRLESELIVQTLLTLLPETAQRVLDLGTGCGNIACALASERPSWQIIATDVSAGALAIAKKNAQRLALPQINFLLSSWFEQIPPQQFSAIVSNPPYIRQRDVHLIHGDLVFEPQLALTPGLSGFEAFFTIVQQAKNYLQPKGWLVFEHGFDQALGLSEILENAGFQNIQTQQDLAGLARVTRGQNPS